MVNTSKPHDLAVDQICDWHRVNNPNDAAIAYLDKDDSKVKPKYCLPRCLTYLK